MAITLVNVTAFASGLVDSCNTAAIPATGVGNLLVVVAASPDYGPTVWSPSGICGFNHISSNVDGLLNEVPYYSLPNPPQITTSTSQWNFANYDDGSGGAGILATADILYIVSAGGAIAINFNCSDAVGIVVFEFHSDALGDWALDDFKMNGSESNVPVLGPGINGTSGAEEVFVSIGVPTRHTNNITGVAGPWIAGPIISGPNMADIAPAYLIGTGNQPGPVFTAATGSDKYTAVAASFKFTPTIPPPPPSGPVCFADGIIPSGAIDGVNTSFTLPSTPNPPGSLILESDTSLLAPGVGFNLSFVLSGTQLKLVYPPKTSLVAWYRTICGSQVPPLYKLNPDQAFDDNAFTSTPTAINSTYFTYGFVNAAKAAQNPLLGFHRKRFSEIQMNVNGSGQFIVTAFPNYILKKDLSYNPYAYVVPPILLQTDPPDDLIRPLNSVGNRVYVKFETNAVGATFDISKAILCGVMDSYAIINPNSG